MAGGGNYSDWESSAHPFYLLTISTMVHTGSSSAICYNIDLTKIKVHIK